MSSNQIKNVAIVGAGGNSGSYMTDALLKTGKHVVTAITRIDSQSKLPDGVIVKKIDYEKPETIVEALKGQDALVITLSGMVHGKDLEEILINAAAEAGVPWILPNEWSPDTANEDLIRDVSVFQSKPKTRQLIQDVGKSSFIGISTGFWYEWSLAIPSAFGIDLLEHKATFYDDGETKISVATWPQVGRTVAALLSLPIESSSGPCLENYANKLVYAHSFTVSQKEMLASAQRATNTSEGDWTITSENSRERYESGLKEIKEGSRLGFVKMLYTRIFYPDGSGDTEHSKGTVNEALRLPNERLDDATQAALERAKNVPAWG